MKQDLAFELFKRMRLDEQAEVVEGLKILEKYGEVEQGASHLYEQEMKAQQKK